MSLDSTNLNEQISQDRIFTIFRIRKQKPEFSIAWKAHWYPVREMILQSLTSWKSGKFTHCVLRIYWFWQPILQWRPHHHFGHTYPQALALQRLKFRAQFRRFCWCHTILGGCTISRVITYRMWSQAKISNSFSHQITLASSRCSFKICGLFHNTWQAIIVSSAESTSMTRHLRGSPQCSYSFSRGPRMHDQRLDLREIVPWIQTTTDP